MIFLLFILSFYFNFLLPRYLFPLYLWVLLVVHTLYFFPSSYPYDSGSPGDFYGILIYGLISRGIAVSVFLRLLNIGRCLLNKQTRKIFRINNKRRLRAIQTTFIAYCVLFVYYLYLALTYILKGFQPAYIAYSLIVLPTLFITLVAAQRLRSSNTNYAKNFWLFGLYLSLALGVFLSASFSYAVIAKAQTYKMVRDFDEQNISYCIQPTISSWLDLTPLTRWNKRKSSDRGATTNHAVLVIQSPESINLYNWSYKQRKWDYLISEFRPDSSISPSELRCNLDPEYFRNMPFFLPKPKL